MCFVASVEDIITDYVPRRRQGSADGLARQRSRSPHIQVIVSVETLSLAVPGRQM